MECYRFTEADPGFPQGEGDNPPGAPACNLANVSKKNCMKLKELILMGGGTLPKFYYVDPQLICVCVYIRNTDRKSNGT